MAALCVLLTYPCGPQVLAAPEEGPADPVYNSTSTKVAQETGPKSSFQENIGDSPQFFSSDPRSTPGMNGKLFSMQSPDRLFGYSRENYHAALSIQGEWTENLYNLNVDEQSSFVTTVSPSVWIGFPWTGEFPVTFSPNNGAVGGSRFLFSGGADFERFQTFLFGGLDYRSYSTDDELNFTGWRVEGLFRYNLPSGFSIRLIDRYARDRDRFDRGSFLPVDFTREEGLLQVSTPSLVRDFSSNMINAGLGYAMTDRYSLDFDLTNFVLDYDDDINGWLDRSDNSYSMALSYHYSPKTSFSIEYRKAFVSYDTEESNDSDYSFYLAGVTWKGTEKTSFDGKAGYQVKQYDSAELDSATAFSLEGQLGYQITAKTGISISLYKALEETDSINDRGMDTIAAGLNYEQRFTYRLRGSCEFRYELNDYQGFTESAAAESMERKDTSFAVVPAIEYVFRDWLTGKLAYSFENRDSNNNSFDYTTQSVLFTVNLAF